MLKNPELFKNVETGLRSTGTLQAFENEHGKILGRAMITLTDIPSAVEVSRTDRQSLTAFEITFDFCNVALGIAVDTNRKTLESSVWGRYQAPNAQKPSEEWVKFFIRTLFENIREDGKFGIPMYCFVNNTADFTAVPTAPPTPTTTPSKEETAKAEVKDEPTEAKDDPTEPATNNEDVEEEPVKIYNPHEKQK